MRKIPLLIFSLLLPLVIVAKPRGRIVCIDNSIFVAMCDNHIEQVVSVQQMDNWCWAACIQAVLRYHDMWVSQSDIVKQVYDGSYNWAASGNRIAQSLNGWNNLYVYSYRDKSIQILIDNLIKHSPLIIGNAEHAYLLTHIYYTQDYWGNINPFKVILINPMTAKEEVRNWSDFFPAINAIILITPNK